MGDKGGQRETKGDKAKSFQPSIQTRHGTKGDKGRQSKVISAQHPDMPWERTGDKERQSKVTPAQHPDTPWETRGDKAKSSQPSIQTRRGRRGETKGDKAKSSQPSIQACHGRQGETKQSDLSFRISTHLFLGLSLLISALFRWPCSISMHMSPRSVTGGVRISIHLSPRSVTGVRFAAGHAAFSMHMSPRSPCSISLRLSPRSVMVVSALFRWWCLPFSAGHVAFLFNSFVSQVCRSWCPPFSVGHVAFRK